MKIVHKMEEIEYGQPLEIRPPEDVEWFISNIYHEHGAVLVKAHKNGNEIKISTDSEGGAWAGFKFFLTYDEFLRVYNFRDYEENMNQTNVDAPALLGYEGVEL